MFSACFRLGEVCPTDQSADKQQGSPAAAGPQCAEGRKCSQALAPGRGKGGCGPSASLPGMRGPRACHVMEMLYPCERGPLGPPASGLALWFVWAP